MDVLVVIADLEHAWDLDSGFFGLLRRGEFDGTKLNRLLGVLEGVERSSDELVNRRLVTLLWYIPMFMSWQRERVHEASSDMASYEKAINKVQGLVERILGVP